MAEWAWVCKTHENESHAEFAFSASEKRRHEKNQDGDRDGRNGECKLNIGLVHNDDHELNGEAEEKEEVEF